jgi:transcriptional regulator with XRE-family HTH domain
VPVRTLAMLRRRARMTQKGAATVLDISVSTLGRYENGLRVPGPNLLRAMARLFRAPVGLVFVAAGVPLPSALNPVRWGSAPLPQVLVRVARVGRLLQE